MNDEGAPGDILQQGRGEPGPGRFRRPGWWPARPARTLAVATLAIGLAAGYLAGHQQGRGSAAAARPTASGSSAASRSGVTLTLSPAPELTQTLGACSAQRGHQLQLGVQFTNQSGHPVTLTSAQAVLPTAGLRQVSQHWTACGELGGTAVPAEVGLRPGASTWLTVTLAVTATCPAAFPVAFSVRYRAGDTPRTDTLPGFSDLGSVPYGTCLAS